MGKVVDIRERLLNRRIDEATVKAGGYDYVDDMQAEREEEYEALEEECRAHCDKLLDQLLDYGIADESHEFSTDFIFVTEALRSCIMRARGFPHFIQEVAERLIEVDYDEETDMVNGKWVLFDEDKFFGNPNDPVIEDPQPDFFTDIEELAKSLKELTEDDKES